MSRESVKVASEVELRPVRDEDAVDVAEFLHAHGAEIGGQVSPDAWAEAILVSWKFDAPNRGFMLVHDGDIVGVYLAFYSERVIDGSIEHFCDLAMWCVDSDYRHHSIRLLKALLEQPGYHFTDFSPSEPVTKINKRFGFQMLDTSRITIRTFPWPSLPGQVRVTSTHHEIEELLTGSALDVYRDHRSGANLLQMAVAKDGQTCHLIFRKAKPGRIRKIPFLRLLHVSDPALFHRAVRPVGRHLFMRHGVREVRAELRLLGAWPIRPSNIHSQRQARMFKSVSMRPDQVDYLYSGVSHFLGLFHGTK